MATIPVLARRQPASAGFTLVEMIVVIAIMAVISTVVVMGQSTYNRSLLLTNTAYTVAFSVRQAQSLGISSRTFAGGANTNVGYGATFASGVRDRYTVFADTSNASLPVPSTCTIGAQGTPEWKPGNCRYNAGDGIVETYVFSRGYTISKFCGKNGSTLYCSDSGLQSLDLVFLRPNTESVLTGMYSGNSVGFTCAQIHIASPGGLAESIVRVSYLGEVSINQTCP